MMTRLQHPRARILPLTLRFAISSGFAPLVSHLALGLHSLLRVSPEISAKEKRHESEEQPQSRTVIRRRSRLVRWRHFKWEPGPREICERRKDMKVKSSLKAGQSSVAILD